MIKKVITTKDFDDNERTETYYFNLTEAEAIEFGAQFNGGFQRQLERIVQAGDEQAIVAILKDFIIRSYGEKSNDGRYFEKSPELSRRFTCTQAYSKLFVELAQNTESATDFINGIIPKAENTPPPVSG